MFQPETLRQQKESNRILVLSEYKTLVAFWKNSFLHLKVNRFRGQHVYQYQPNITYLYLQFNKILQTLHPWDSYGQEIKKKKIFF